MFSKNIIVLRMRISSARTNT